ncbi:MAG: hypothetical protein VYA30_16245 [Myxococcota bacterium]|nr:hypothetical protein [Myxococcota bacterium]
MPIIYQGRLNKKTVAKPVNAFRRGQSHLEGLQYDRTDIRACWPGPEAFMSAEKILGDHGANFWVDIAAHADFDTLQQIPTWLTSLEGGHIAVMCLKEGYEAEIRITLPGQAPERFDHQRYEARFKSHANSTTIKSCFLSSPKHMSKQQKAFAIQRVASGFETLCHLTADDKPLFEDWVKAQHRVLKTDLSIEFDQEPLINRRHLNIETSSQLPNFSHLGTKVGFLENTPVDLVVTTGGERYDWCQAFWAQLVNQLPQVDVVLIRATGTRQAINDVLDRLELYAYHPGKQNHQFGLSTIEMPQGPTPDRIEALLTNRKLMGQIIDWDLRWSGLNLDLDGLESSKLVPPQSFYSVRSDSAKSIDRLFLSLALEDPGTPLFRSARRQLAERFGEIISRESAWEYVGPTPASHLGQQYGKLHESLMTAAKTILDTTDPLPSKPSSSWIARLPMINRPSPTDDHFVEPVFEAISLALPGFQYDRRAHITDQYFVEYVRRIDAGFQVIQLKRQAKPMGFFLRIAVSRYRIPFEDLVASPNTTIPGCVVDAVDLFPERADGWTYHGQRQFKDALTDLTEILRVRINPYLDATAHVLQVHAQTFLGE